MSSSCKTKSTSELEEEMLAKMLKLKARPLNKKILAAPALPAPHPPEFQEFHIETMAQASQHAETSSVVSTEMSKHNDWRPHLTEPKSPLLQTMLGARPSNAKTSNEIEQEELEKVPLNQKLSLNSDSCREKPLQRNTTPNLLLLRTEERGAEEKKKSVREFIYKQIEDERVPPKPEPKQCTRPEPFQLESQASFEELANDLCEFSPDSGMSLLFWKEERALKQLRRAMVPHARPVPNFNNPFLPQKSNKETTKPKSPKLRVIRRVSRRTMMMASHMR
ncbi:TPX2 central domain [Arabidopsis suecica]|uniref:TPX2 central domain n=1 Tax=Arabidopsis suecica TaxID=45249 RepID=A0A8T1XP93_ARASU|nr:TPX2 central domain [Arabidopsis suecica]